MTKAPNAALKRAAKKHPQQPTVEEKLRAEIKTLKGDQRADHANFARFEQENGNRFAQLEHLRALAAEGQRKAEVKLAEEVKTNNELRDLYQQSLLTIARMQGRMDAIEEAKPPVMVPQVLSTNFDATETLHGRIGGYGSQAKPWYHK